MTRRWNIILLVLTLSVGTAHATTNPIRRSRQCIVVVAANWSSPTGVLRAFERAETNGAWKTSGPEVPVVLGKKGVGWGVGVLNSEPGAKPRKSKATTGAGGGLRLGPSSVAPAKSAAWVKLRYLPLKKYRRR